jgi:hypothetical protein
MTHQHRFWYSVANDDYRCPCGASLSKWDRVAGSCDAQPCSDFRGDRSDAPKVFCICGWSASAHLKAQLPDRVRSGRELLSW